MLSSPDEFSAILIKRHAGTASFNKQKLKTKSRIFDKQNSISETNNDETNNDKPSRKMTRLGTPLKNFSDLCFFRKKTKTRAARVFNNYPDQYDNIFWMMGSLHIELSVKQDFFLLTQKTISVASTVF